MIQAYPLLSDPAHRTMPMRPFTTLRLILGDQLNVAHSWFSTKDPDILYTLMEVRQETDYTRHHIQKITAFFAAMRAFSGHLKDQGHAVAYVRLDDTDNRQSFEKNLVHLIEKHNMSRLEYQLPDEYRLDQVFQNIARTLPVSVSSCDTEHFLTHRHDVADFFKNKKQFLMESFYRSMRKKHEVLMDNGTPEGGKWNYDAANRQAYDATTPIPAPCLFENDVTEIRKMIQHHRVAWFGDMDDNILPWPVNRSQALELMNYQFKKPHGKDACPFNSLFWDFHHRHRPLLEKNARIGMMYRTWDKKSGAEKDNILAQAALYKETLETL